MTTINRATYEQQLQHLGMLIDKARHEGDVGSIYLLLSIADSVKEARDVRFAKTLTALED